jgi:predicted DsbA family dithiol-disulfide isomerase
MSNTINIEVVSDHVCPWCYVGKRRLEAAIAQRPELDINVTWQPFQLSPDMPREGRKRLDHYREIFGEERAEMIMGSMKDTGFEEGIAFGSDPDAMSPNTLSAHVLMLWGREDEGIDADELVEKLFHAHHVACEDIGNHAVLVRIAEEVGMDAADVAAKLAAGDSEEKIAQLIKESAARGVSGVPFFIINGRFGLSGAQPADTLVAAFDQVAAEVSGDA